MELDFNEEKFNNDNEIDLINNNEEETIEYNILDTELTDYFKLKQGQNHELFMRLQNGDISVRNKIFENNLRLVLTVLKPYKHLTNILDDLLQVGCIGLLKAVDNFKLSFNVEFSTYAMPTIRGNIQTFMRQQNNSIKVLRTDRDLAYKVFNILNHSNENLSIYDISEKMNVDIKELETALLAINLPISLDANMNSEDNEDEYTLNNVVGNPDDNIETLIDMIPLKDAIEGLSDRERKILKYRFWHEMTQKKIGSIFNISQSQISRLQKKIIKKLRTKLVK